MVIGIDPDLEKCGVAFVEDGLLTSLEAHGFFALITLIDLNPDAVYVVEDVELNKAIYARHAGKNAKVRERIGQNVGQVKAVARLIAQYLELKDCRYQMVAPLKGRFKKAKEDRALFNRITGWTGSSNADKRDAGMLALYGIRKGQYIPRPSEVPH